jgi:hypothetical protein
LWDHGKGDPKVVKADRDIPHGTIYEVKDVGTRREACALIQRAKAWLKLSEEQQEDLFDRQHAQWLRFWREISFYLRMLRWLEEMRLRCVNERSQAILVSDYESNFASPILLSTTHGVFNGANYGTNTTEEGRVYVRITGGPTFTVALYTGLAATGLVASGTATAGNAASLVEQNNSGLTGNRGH